MTMLLTGPPPRGNEQSISKPSRMIMASKAERGTKRTCQNDECEARFYDLMRDPIICPICETPYALEVAAAAAGDSRSLPRTLSAASVSERLKPSSRNARTAASRPDAFSANKTTSCVVSGKPSGIAPDFPLNRYRTPHRTPPAQDSFSISGSMIPSAPF